MRPTKPNNGFVWHRTINRVNKHCGCPILMQDIFEKRGAARHAESFRVDIMLRCNFLRNAVSINTILTDFRTSIKREIYCLSSPLLSAFNPKRKLEKTGNRLVMPTVLSLVCAFRVGNVPGLLILIPKRYCTTKMHKGAHYF